MQLLHSLMELVRQQRESEQAPEASSFLQRGLLHRRPQGKMLGALCFLLSVGFLSSCGARTSLRGAQPCPIEGETLPCQGVCGEGVVTCEGGYWSKCQVPLVTEACENSCGEGTRRCEEEVWSVCQVERTERACENSCGAGLEVCEEDQWSTCEVDRVELSCQNKCGTGVSVCENDSWAACTAPQPLPPVLRGTIRDFRDSHPDFENLSSGVDPGLVERRLGDDGKPVYAGGPSGTLTTSGRFYFDQWYRSVPGVNWEAEIQLPLQASAEDARLYVYHHPQFFPIDGQLFGNEGREHNFHFTLEVQGEFTYQGGEVFRFSGDDDVFVFIHRQLVIDLGGLHQTLSAEVSLDDVASELGLVLGETYELHSFFAERHTVESNFMIETSIAGLGECPD